MRFRFRSRDFSSVPRLARRRRRDGRAENRVAESAARFSALSTRDKK